MGKLRHIVRHYTYKLIRKPNKELVRQIKLPDQNDTDPHPRLLFGTWGIHAGEGFMARLPQGWTRIRIEVSWKTAGAASWYIPDYPDICPVGLFCQIEDERG